MSTYQDVKNAIKAKNAQAFRKAFQEAEEFVMEDVPERKFTEIIHHDAVPDYEEDEYDADSSGTQMPTGRKVVVPGTDAYDEVRTKTIGAHQEKKITKTALHVFFDGLKADSEIQKYDENKKMEYVLNFVGPITENDMGLLQELAENLFPNDQQAFFDLAEQRNKNNGELAAKIHAASPKGKIEKLWADCLDKYLPLLNRTIGLIEWLMEKGYLRDDGNGNLTTIPGPHNGMNEVADRLAKLSYKLLLEQKQVLPSITPVALVYYKYNGHSHEYVNEFAYDVTEAYDKADKMIHDKRHAGYVTQAGREAKEVAHTLGRLFANLSSSSSSTTTHTGTTNEMFAKWDEIKERHKSGQQPTSSQNKM